MKNNYPARLETLQINGEPGINQHGAARCFGFMVEVLCGSLAR